MIFKLMTTFLVGVFNIEFTNGFTTTSVINHMSFAHDVSIGTDSYDYNDTFGSGHDNDYDYSHSESESESESKSESESEGVTANEIAVKGKREEEIKTLMDGIERGIQINKICLARPF